MSTSVREGVREVRIGWGEDLGGMLGLAFEELSKVEDNDHEWTNGSGEDKKHNDESSVWIAVSAVVMSSCMLSPSKDLLECNQTSRSK
jgi:hypothetical protein